MAMDTLEYLERLREKRDSLIEARAREQERLAAAEKAHAEAVASLKDEFGCEDLESAERLLKQMQDEVEAALDEITKRLQGF
jgi:hypothetical protein